MNTMAPLPLSSALFYAEPPTEAHGLCNDCARAWATRVRTVDVPERGAITLFFCDECDAWWSDGPTRTGGPLAKPTSHQE